MENDEILQAAQGINPDNVWNGGSPARTTFIYTKNRNLWTTMGIKTHIALIEDEPELQEELIKLYAEYGKTEWNSSDKLSYFLRRDFSEYAVGVLGRIGNMRGNNVCSFWDSPLNSSPLLKQCLQVLISDDCLDINDIVILPPYSKPSYVKDFIAGQINQAMNPQEKQRMDMLRNLHLMPGKEKKQAMGQLGFGSKSPASIKYGLQPGQKHWALASEDFSFKKWLDNFL